MILEADVVCVTEGSIHTTVSPILRSWNIAESSGTLRGDVSPAGSQTVAWYQTVTMGTRETQYALLVFLTGAGVCDVKPIDGKIPQMAYWESDSPIVPLKQGNSCGGKGRTVEPLGQGHIFRTQMRVKDDNKTVLTTYPEKDGEVLLKSRMREIFTSGSVRGLIVTSGLLPQTRGVLWALLDVTGGKGFIGTNLVSELKRRGHEVWVCDIGQSEGEKYIRCDVGKHRQVERMFEGVDRDFDYVYHLAAEYGRWNGEDYYENLWMTNTIGTKHILRIQEKKKFRMIFFSSAEVYGDYEGRMSEDVMDTIPIKQMNDYAMTKWVGEMQVLNSAEMFGTETVRVRPVNAYGPHEPSSPYRGVIPMFIYRALHDLPYTVYGGHKRIFDYVEDTCRTFANIVDNFVTGEVYNVGGRPEWETDIKRVSDIILHYLGKDDSLVTYKEGEPFTTKVKHIDFSKAVRDLSHDPKVPIEEGIPKTIEWMKSVYNK